MPQDIKLQLDSATVGAVRESCLAAFCSVGAAAAGETCRLLLLAVLVGHVADCDLGVAALAAQLLIGGLPGGSYVAKPVSFP